MTPNRVNRTILDHQRKYAKIMHFFSIFPASQQMAWDGPKWGREVLFPANPDLADILGDTDFDFENFYI